MTTEIVPTNQKNLIIDIKHLINQAKSHIAYVSNSQMTMLYWQIGKRINQDVLQFNKAEYGKEIVRKLSQELTYEYGRGFTYSNLTRMINFSDVFSEDKIVATVSQLLTWSHIVELIPIKDGSIPYFDLCSQFIYRVFYTIPIFEP
jgi:hypothetical protein